MKLPCVALFVIAAMLVTSTAFAQRWGVINFVDEFGDVTDQGARPHDRWSDLDGKWPDNAEVIGEVTWAARTF